MNWRPHTEQPATGEPISALIAVRDDDDGGFFLLGLYLWRADHWIHEDDGKPLGSPAYWWLPEAELMAELEAGL